MTATTLLSQLQAAGFQLRTDRGRLLVSPASRLTADQRDLIAANKEGLLVALSPPLPLPRPPADPPAGAVGLVQVVAVHPDGTADVKLVVCPSCKRPVDSRGCCWKCCERICSECGRATGSAFIQLCNACGIADGEGD